MVEKNAKPQARKQWKKPELVRMGEISVVAAAKKAGILQTTFS